MKHRCAKVKIQCLFTWCSCWIDMLTQEFWQEVFAHCMITNDSLDWESGSKRKLTICVLAQLSLVQFTSVQDQASSETDHTVSVIVQQCGCEEAGPCSSVKRIVKWQWRRVTETAVTEFSQCSHCGQCNFFQHPHNQWQRLFFFCTDAMPILAFLNINGVKRTGVSKTAKLEWT